MQPYRLPQEVPECPCHDQRRGTLFQELDDDPVYFRGSSEKWDNIDGKRFYMVHMQHTPQCIAKRKRERRHAYGQPVLASYEIVMSGNDYADGAWWRWKD